MKPTKSATLKETLNALGFEACSMARSIRSLLLKEESPVLSDRRSCRGMGLAVGVRGLGTLVIERAAPMQC
jgi:hypothetical protein